MFLSLEKPQPLSKNQKNVVENVMIWMEREKKTIYMGHLCEISLIAKYFAISEMYKIILCTNGVAPCVPYPIEFPEVRWWLRWWRNLSDASSLLAKYSLIAKFGLLLLNFADGETSLELCQNLANGKILWTWYNFILACIFLHKKGWVRHVKQKWH